MSSTIPKIDPQFTSILSKLKDAYAEAHIANLVVRKGWFMHRPPRKNLSSKEKEERMLKSYDESLNFMRERSRKLDKIYKQAEILAKKSKENAEQNLKSLENAFSNGKTPSQKISFLRRQCNFLCTNKQAKETYHDGRWLGVLKLSEQILKIAKDSNHGGTKETAHQIVSENKNYCQEQTNIRQHHSSFLAEIFALLKANVKYAKDIRKAYQNNYTTEVDSTPPSLQRRREKAFEDIKGKKLKKTINNEIERAFEKGQSIRSEYLWALVRTKNDEGELVLNKEKLHQFRDYMSGIVPNYCGMAKVGKKTK